MMINSIDRDKLTNFVRDIGIATENISLREEMQGIKTRRTIRHEIEAKPKIEKKVDKNKKEIEKLKQSIKKIEKMFKASQKKKHDKKVANRINS